MRFRVLSCSLAFQRADDVGEGALVRAGCEVIRPPRPSPLSRQELHEHLLSMDAIVAGGDDLCAEVIERAAADRLKVISRWGVGYDTVDMEAAARCGVVVTNTPGLTADAVADMTFGLMLSLARRIPEGDALIRRGGWDELQGVSLWRKCIGLVGFGQIGQAVARRAQGFEMRVLAFDIAPDVGAAGRLGVELVPLEQLLREADFVSVHAALTPESRGLIGADQLGLMKPTAYLVNTSRGPLVDTAALVAALTEGRIAGAGLDVHDPEPLPPGHPIVSAPRTVLTPHSSFNTIETCRAVSAMVVENTLAALEGREPPFVVRAK